MMRLLRGRTLRRTGPAMVGIIAVVTIASAERASAQSTIPVLARVDSLASARDTAQAKAIVDSVLADTDPSAKAYPGALYWRGVLAGLPAGRTDLLRLIVEFPFHARVSDALYLLAHDDLAAGNTDVARRRLERITQDFAGSTVGPLASAELARIELARGNMSSACTAFDSALAHIPDSDVERRNRVNYDARPCERYRAELGDSIAEADQAAARDSAARAAAEARRRTQPAGRAATPQKTSPRRAAAPPAGKWSVQVAAYATESDATRLATRLKGLGYDARVTAGTGPYRVRVGRYASLGDATAMVHKLKAAKFTAIVVDTERP